MRKLLVFTLLLFPHASAAQDLQIKPTAAPATLAWETAAGSKWRQRSDAVVYPNQGSLKFAVSPDGRWIATIDRTNRILIWEAGMQDAKHVLEVPLQLKGIIGFQARLRDVTFSFDGATLQAWNQDALFRWKTADLKSPEKITPKNGIRWFSYLPGSDKALLCTAEKLEVCDATTLQPVETVPLTSKEFPYEMRLTLSANGQRLAHVHEDAVIIIDLAGKQLQRFKEWKGVSSLALSADGKVLAVGSSSAERGLFLFEVDTRKQLHAHTSQSGWFTALAFSPTGKTLTAGRDNGGGIEIFDVASGKSRLQFGGIAISTDRLQFSPDGNTLYAVDNYEPALHRWDIEPADKNQAVVRGKIGDTLPLLKLEEVKHFPNIHGSLLAFSSDGKRLALRTKIKGIYETHISVLDIDSGKLLKPWLGSSRGVQALLFSPDGKQLFAADAGISIYDAATGKKESTILGSSPQQIAWTNEGNLLAIVADISKPGLTSYAAPDWKKKLTFSERQLPDFRSGNVIAISPTEPVAALGNQNGHVQLWHTDTNKPGLLIDGPNFVSSLAYSPDGKLLVVGGGQFQTNNPLGVFAVATGELLHTLIGHHSGTRQAVFVNEGKHLVSLDNWDCYVWDVATGRAIGRLNAKQNPMAIAASHDGTTLAVSAYYNDGGGLRLLRCAGI